MNDMQKKVAVVTVGILAVMLLFPPFHRQSSSGSFYGNGYSFILSPPMSVATIDIATLLTQWLFVVTAGFVAYRYFDTS
ncbi:hypothetical protein [Halomonas sp. CSM-2]|uniref:hypothetical protein n=1 Tax=Halomonas sp. CSM-2 TaxID=1975722 RepID=UPI00111C1F76|nr:hypothetical protein [Halomonas sp. CSM-2]